MAYQEKGRYMNPWMGGRDSPLAFFLSWFRDKVSHNIFFNIIYLTPDLFLYVNLVAKVAIV